ncbi:MAG: hypothetical protein HWE13_08075 [Gammaproteobacteria bacterium]|nr:hypothetical protein [Gammaproteobacteria bacterium]NVK88069.1 hypothetical protein [Gammaproteobacteria bacterium]
MRTFFLLCLVSLSLSVSAIDYRTGDKALDRWLINIDFVAREQQQQAFERLCQEFKVNPELLGSWRDDYELSVAQMTAALVARKILDTDLEATLEQFSKTPVKKYQALLKELGMPEFSDQFKTFRQEIQRRAPEQDLEAESRNIFNEDNLIDAKPKKGGR